MENQARISTKTLVIIAAALLAAAAAGAYFVFAAPGGGSSVEISVDGEVVERIDLAAVGEIYTIELPGNTVLVERDGVSIMAADCPDKLCVAAGRLESGALPIVCLPNRVVIRLVSADGTGVDAVAGR